MESEPSTVEIAELGKIYARIYGFLNDRWDNNTPPPMDERNMIDSYIQRLPFAIGKLLSFLLFL